ncbi:MAG: acetyl-CoA C-acetyltransferase, partial [Deltaproteobacteria bacterium]|nr:acetyl-CoA C-acetyltransferase [Deltaproteobacteria bacterium]
LAKIIGHGGASKEPEWFTTAPVDAIRKLLDRSNLKTGDIDLWEINEAFAVVMLAAVKELKLDPKRVNIKGGAVALGHPIGASGARLLTTLLYTMQEQKAKRGLVSLCNGGGEAVAMVVERT